MLTLYKSMVRSKLEYCCPVWTPSKVSDIQSLENVQRNFTRKVVGCGDLDYWDRLKKLNLMSLQRRRERYCIIHTWNILQNQAPNDINLNFHSHNRHGVKITQPPLNNKAQASVRTDYENSFKIKAARLWNLLPRNVNTQITLDTFKAALGYTAANRNSLLDWRMEGGYPDGGLTWYCCPDASPA